MSNSNETHDMNRDPITGAPGSHPVGVGVGGTGGAVAGAVVGSVLGPVGTLVGGTIGAIAGAAAGKGVAERIDPTGEAEYWEGEYTKRPYFDSNYTYDDYAPAYSYGSSVRAQHAGRDWDDALEGDLERGWDNAKGTSRMAWAQAKDAVRDAWNGVERVLPGDADRDGR